MKALELLRRQPPRRLALLAVAAVVVLGLVGWATSLLLRPGGGGEPAAVGGPGTSAVSGDPTAVDPGGSPEPGASVVGPGATPTSGGSPGGGSSTPPPSDATIAAMEARVVALVNQERADAGCAALTVDNRLATAAREHARDMATRDYFSHTTPEGETFDARIRDAGYRLSSAAENIAFGQTTAEAVVESWMASADHRRNILDCSLRNVGVGLAYSASSQPYWVESLASPA